MTSLSKLLTLSLPLIFLYGCSTAYKPTPAVTGLKGSMTKAEAISIVKESLETVERVGFKQGLCGGQGLPDGRSFNKAWRPNIKNPEIEITEKGFSLNAFRYVQSTSVSGYVSAPIASTTFNEGSAFRYTINFADIEYVRMFHEANTLPFGTCLIREGQSAAIMGMFSSMSDFYGTTLEKSKLDRFIAAMMILAPQALLQTGS